MTEKLISDGLALSALHADRVGHLLAEPAGGIQRHGRPCSCGRCYDAVMAAHGEPRLRVLLLSGQVQTSARAAT